MSTLPPHRYTGLVPPRPSAGSITLHYLNAAVARPLRGLALRQWSGVLRGTISMRGLLVLHLQYERDRLLAEGRGQVW